jgi:predicted metal-dependent HD superfamily phosphohydrolase
MPPDPLATRWSSLMQACHVEPALAAPHLEALVAAYGEPHRAYHRLDHVAHVFAELDAVPLLDASVEWATWYHDVVYHPGQRDNETLSAALARTTLAALGVQRLEQRVVQLIEATRLHRADTDDAAALLFLDADLAILGAESPAYRRYAEGVREEHRAIPSFLYAMGRRAFLRELLGRPSIFMTPHFRERYDRQARENLRSELAQLEGD